MKISLKWLSDFVNVEPFFEQPQELARLLTRAGLEVEGMEAAGRDLAHVVVGEIIEKNKHPDADRLTVCLLNVGDKELRQIVCGAKNHSAGDKVAVALPGAVLPGNFQIKEGQIRGVESLGMLCSLKELGLPEDGTDGIVLLDAIAPVGQSIADYFDLNDVIFELKVTPNRADCLSHLGLAREISVLTGQPLRKMEIKFKEDLQSSQDLLKVQVQQRDLCSRFTGRYLKHVHVGSTPTWMVNRLSSVGVKSINNVVDVTNYVMFELGQPLHAYDATKLAGRQLVVSQASKGEKFVTFDGSEVILNGTELAIQDSEKTIGLAGVIGGKNSGIDQSTTEVFLEAAHFQAMSVRRTSRAHGIDTDACYRFSRGVDPNNVLIALNRATQLLVECAAAEPCRDAFDILSETELAKAPLQLDLHYLESRLGYQIAPEQVEHYLRSIGCQVQKTQSILHVQSPSFRMDLHVSVDLVEEVARLHGYENIPETLPRPSEAPTAHVATYRHAKYLEDQLTGLQLNQALNYAFTSRRLETQFLGGALRDNLQAIDLINPLNDELGRMRTLVSPQLVENARLNFHRGNHFGRLFEIGSVFGKTQEGVYKEEQHLGLCFWGHSRSLSGGESAQPLVIELKETIEKLLRCLSIKSYRWNFELKPQYPFCHPNQYAELSVEGAVVGFISAVHPQWIEQEKMRVSVALAELKVETLMKRHPRPVRFQSIPAKTQPQSRDVSFILSTRQRLEPVLSEMKKIAGPLCAAPVEVLSLYQSEQMTPERHSVSFRLHFQHAERTLEDQELNDIMGRIQDSVTRRFGLLVP